MKKVLNHVARRAGPEVQARINALKIGQKMQDLPEHLWHKSFRFYVKEDPTRKGGPNLRIIRLDPKKPSLTVTGFVFNKFVHPKENRFITVREAARLQGFPDDHEFVGPLTSVQMQVGNAVPVPLAEAAVRAVLEHANFHETFKGTRFELSSLPAVSLFSGAGGLDLGLEKAKSGSLRFRSVCAVEFNEDCCNTLRKNFGRRMEVIHQDISEVSGKYLLSKIGMQKGQLPLLIGGPPCQAFSQAGKQKATDDPRGNLIYEYLRMIKELAPTYFVMENVFGLKSAEQGQLMPRILKRMEALGYNVSHKLLHAIEFGAPQQRRRFFFIGVKRPRLTVPMPEPTHADEPGLFKLHSVVTVGEAFAGLPKVAGGSFGSKPKVKR